MAPGNSSFRLSMPHSVMPSRRTLVSSKARHLKWRALDVLEEALLVLSGLLLLGFISTVVADAALRTMLHPWLEAPEWTLGFFVWGCFLGAAVAVRRDQHFRLAAIASGLHGWPRLCIETFTRLVVLAVAACMAFYGYAFVLTGFTLYLQPSTTPIAPLYAAIPVSGLLIALFCVEELVNGWRNGFEQKPKDGTPSQEKLTSPAELVAGPVQYIGGAANDE